MAKSPFYSDLMSAILSNLLAHYKPHFLLHCLVVQDKFDQHY